MTQHCEHPGCPVCCGKVVIDQKRVEVDSRCETQEPHNYRPAFKTANYCICSHCENTYCHIEAI